MLETRSLAGFMSIGVMAWQAAACGGSTRPDSAEEGAAGSSSARGGSGGAAPVGPSVGGGGESLAGSGTSSPPGSGGDDSEVLGGAAGSGATGGNGGAPGSAGTSGAAGEGAEKVVLFDGSRQSFDGWISERDKSSANPWKNNGDGTMTVVSGTGDIRSKRRFRDVFVHVEYMTPKVITSGGLDTGVGAVFLNGSYGLWIADADGLPPSHRSCGALNGVSPPLEIACYEQEAWNTYEAEFQAPLCDPGNPTLVVTPARFVEVKLNGTIVQRNVDVPAPTLAGRAQSCEPQGLMLMDHSNPAPISFRNIWAIPRE